MATKKISELNNATIINPTDIFPIVQDSETLKITFNKITDMLFPIGSIVIKNDNSDYSNWLGFTWQRTLAGKVAVGLDEDDEDFNEIGKTGGEKTHTLTIEEMPKHRHGMRTSAGSGGQVDNMPWGTALAAQTTNTEYTGGNGAHNNLQPYKVVAYWERIS